VSTRRFDDYEFTSVGTLQPQRDAGGRISEFFPDSTSLQRRGLRLHRNGAGPFCRFQVSTQLCLTGVYVLTVDDTVCYVGECADLARRFNTGYGSIAARNRYEGGQNTNCKVNALVLDAVKSGQSVELWFLQTQQRKDVETELLLALHPPWNGRRSAVAVHTAASVTRESSLAEGGNKMRESAQPPVRAMIRQAAEALGGPFTISALSDWVLQHYPGTNTNTIQAQIVYCTVNNPSRVHQPVNKTPRAAVDTRYDFLFRSERGGLLEQYDPARHGWWAIVRRDRGEVTVARIDGATTREPSTKEGGQVEGAHGSVEIQTAKPPGDLVSRTPSASSTPAMRPVDLPTALSGVTTGLAESQMDGSATAETDELHFDFIGSAALRQPLTMDYGEASRAYSVQAYKATGLLLCGLLEGMLFDAIRRPEVSRHAAYRQAVERFPRLADGSIDFARVGLSQFAIAAEQVSLLAPRAARMVGAARDFRHTVHPSAEVRLSSRAEQEDADLLFSLVRLVHRDLGRHTSARSVPSG
jgi:hypothetical protein